MSVSVVCAMSESNAIRSYVRNGGCDGAQTDWLQMDNSQANTEAWGPNLMGFQFVSGTNDWALAGSTATITPVAGDSMLCATADDVTQRKWYMGWHFTGDPSIDEEDYWFHCKISVDVLANFGFVISYGETAETINQINDPGSNGIWQDVSFLARFTDDPAEDRIDLRAGLGQAGTPHNVCFDEIFMRPVGLCKIMANQVIANSSIVSPAHAHGNGQANGGGYIKEEFAT